MTAQAETQAEQDERQQVVEERRRRVDWRNLLKNREPFIGTPTQSAGGGGNFGHAGIRAKAPLVFVKRVKFFNLNAATANFSVRVGQSAPAGATVIPLFQLRARPMVIGSGSAEPLIPLLAVSLGINFVDTRLHGSFLAATRLVADAQDMVPVGYFLRKEEELYLIEQTGNLLVSGTIYGTEYYDTGVTGAVDERELFRRIWELEASEAL